MPEPTKRYPKSILNPRGDTHVGVRGKGSFPFFETYNYTPVNRKILQEQEDKKPMGQYTSEMTASRKLLDKGPKKKSSGRKWMETEHSNPDWEEVGMPREIEGTPLEKVVNMYPTKKEGSGTPMRKLMAKKITRFRPGPEATNIKRETGPVKEEGGKRKYNAYLRQYKMEKGIQEGNQEAGQETSQNKLDLNNPPEVKSKGLMERSGRTWSPKTVLSPKIYQEESRKSRKK